MAQTCRLLNYLEQLHTISIIGNICILEDVPFLIELLLYKTLRVLLYQPGSTPKVHPLSLPKLRNYLSRHHTGSYYIGVLLEAIHAENIKRPNLTSVLHCV